MSGWTRRVVWLWASAMIMLPAGAGIASASSLPDGRSYEMVSPPVKNGADIMIDAGRTRASEDGTAVTLSSLTAFADVRGTGIATDYLSVRSSEASPGTTGWATHAITPRQNPLALLATTQGLQPLWVGEFSAQLTSGVFFAWSPVTDEDPNVTNVANLYRRDDLRTPGAGHYQLLTSCPACTVPIPVSSIGDFGNFLQRPGFLAASTDLSHVLFASGFALTPDAIGGGVYEWVNGNLRSIGFLPDSACGLPPCPAGGAAISGTHAMSDDGSRIVFTDGSTGQIYERIDGAQTVAVSVSERTTPDPNGIQPASYQTASSDGSRIFFTTAEKMTDDDTDSAVDLYMWDASGPPSGRLSRLSVDNNLLDTQGGVDGVVGVSDDGSYVYFVATGQLVAGQPSGVSGPQIYVWHSGSAPAIAYVGEMAGAGQDEQANLVNGILVSSRVTPNGRHMAFVSHSGQGLLSAHGGTDYDQSRCSNGCAEVYLYTADTNSLACASCRPDGEPATATAFVRARAGTGAATSTLHFNHPLSVDGRWVFFNTAEPLVSGDANGKIDAYEYNGETHETHLLSTGTAAADSYFLDASPDGKNVFLVTRERLLGWDQDTNYDLYDARVGGGFPEPAPIAPACVGDACQGTLAVPPGTTAAGSTVLRGVGNAKPVSKRKVKPRKCKRGFARKKIRGKVVCVKKRKTRAGKRGRTSPGQRGAR